MARPVEDILQEVQAVMNANPGAFSGLEPGNVIAHLGKVAPDLWNQLNEAYTSQGGQGFTNAIMNGAAKGTLFLPGIGTAAGAAGGAISHAFSSDAPTLNEYFAKNTHIGQGLLSGLQGSQIQAQQNQAAKDKENQATQQTATAAQQADKKNQDLATSQLNASGDLFKQALAALQTPQSTFTPEFSQSLLDNTQQNILTQGKSALSNVQAGAARRGISGSSIEQYGLAATEGQITNQLATATFDFLMKSGELGQQNRQFIAQQLFNSAQQYLGAGQQTNLSGDQLSLQRQTLAEQTRQFGLSYAQSQQQFSQNMAMQQQQAAQNMQLLLQQLNKKPSSNPFAAALGGILPGATTGATAGASFGGIGAAYGALGGAALGGITAGLGESLR